MRLFFLYCPFCNSNKWNLINTPTKDKVKFLVSRRCEQCRKFTYTNSAIKSKIILPVSFTSEEGHEVEVEIGDYHLAVNYSESKTYIHGKPKPVVNIMSVAPPQFRLVLDRAVEFNWHDQDHILKKIKTFIMLT